MDWRWNERRVEQGGYAMQCILRDAMFTKEEEEMEGRSSVGAPCVLR